MKEEDIEEALLERRVRFTRIIEDADWLLDEDSFDAEQLRMRTLTEVREAE